MKRLSVVVLLALLASILFPFNVVAEYSPVKTGNVCDGLLHVINKLPPGSPALGNLVNKASKSGCGIVADHGALLALYYSTGGDNWSNNSNWINNPDHCTWYGAYCGEEGRVYTLNLFQNNLVGEIPPELGSLSNLMFLTLSGNQLSGSIPTELGNLSKLASLDLSNNQLSGPIPASLGSLSEIIILLLGNNQLNGSIPPELGNLSLLARLELDHNQLVGSIPTELGNLPEVWLLVLSDNQLSGQVPSSFLNFASENYNVLILFGSGNIGLCVPVELYNALNIYPHPVNDFAGHICQ